MISIVIPTLRRAEYVRTCLADLGAMRTQAFEVLVIEQCSGELADLSRNLYSFSLRHFRADAPNASLARNIGLIEATSEIVLFLDDDVRIPNPDFLRNHLRHYDDPTVPGVYGQVLEVDQEPTNHPVSTVIETDSGWMNLPANYGRPCRTRNGGSGNLSVRRDWALAVGGMDAWFERGARREESEFNLRLTSRYGYLKFDPEAGLTHLSAGGGSRTWGRVRRTVPMHHIVGHWYFLLRVICDRTLGRQGVFREMRHIAIALLKNPQAGNNPFNFLRNAARSAWGLGIALFRILRGPRRVDTLEPTTYRENKAARPTE